MRLHIIARGKIGRSPESELVDRYLKRLTWPHKITELPDRGGALPPVERGSRTVLLDEKGDQFSSMDLAKLLERWRDEGVSEVRFCLGAADGFDDADRNSADKLIAFGRATWPHLMARAMLAGMQRRAALSALSGLANLTALATLIDAQPNTCVTHLRNTTFAFYLHRDTNFATFFTRVNAVTHCVFHQCQQSHGRTLHL